MTPLYNPWDHLAQYPHVLLAFDRLEHAAAYWVPAEQVILLDDRLDQAGRRSALAHELAHVDRQDGACAVGPDGERQSRRQEARADALAATRLLPLDELADALVWALSYDELAEALHVDRRIVRARLLTLTPAETDHIERRIADRGDSA